MSIHILFLNILILISTAFGTAFIQSIIIASTGKVLDETTKLSKYIILYYSIILLSLCFIDRINLIQGLQLKMEYKLLLAVPLGLLVFCLEILPSIIKGKIQKYNIEIELSDRWSGQWVKLMPLVILISILEEIIFRGIWYEILVESMNLNVITFIALSSIFFGISHLGLGRGIFMQKVISGVCFSILFIISGNLLLVVLTHIFENIIIIGRYNKS